MTGFPCRQSLSRLIGVIDLMDQFAVHAVAGQRSQYRPVAVTAGDAVALATHYQRLGVDHLYIADLDSIRGGSIDIATVMQIVDAAAPRSLLLDIGWTGQHADTQIGAMLRIQDQFPEVHWITASETMRGDDAVLRLADLVGPAQVALGLDFRAGQFVSANRLFAETSEIDDRSAVSATIERAAEVGVNKAVVLDLAAVGVAAGPLTASICQSIRGLVPDWWICSGGGVRDAADLDRMIAAGCDRCLVATALHGIV